MIETSGQDPRIETVRHQFADLRAQLHDMRAERDRWRRIAMDQAERLAAYARADVARDRPAPMRAWTEEDR